MRRYRKNSNRQEMLHQLKINKFTPYYDEIDYFENGKLEEEAKNFEFTIYGELPDLNKIIEAGKKGWQIYAELKAKETLRVKLSIRNKIGIKKITLNNINVKITFYCKNKRKDKDNVIAGVKFIMDGIKEAGIIKDDGWQYINDYNFEFKIDNYKPRIKVELIEIRR